MPLLVVAKNLGDADTLRAFGAELRRRRHLRGQGILVQPDVHHERDCIPRVCIFIDGSRHEVVDQGAHDQAVREALKDQGFRVVAIKSTRSIADRYQKVPTYLELLACPSGH